jgi:outer membrane protein OmpA-like peptidoglycan-associated protein
MFLRFFMIVLLAVAVVGGMSACATKGFVRTSVGEVNDKVDALGSSVEETQERTRQNEGRIGEVDATAKGAAQSAQQANAAAADAATAARTADSRAIAAGTKADELDRSSRRLVYEAVMSEDQGRFAFGRTVLPAEIKARLDTLITELSADPQAAWFEIEGHTDNTGSQDVNERIGLDRAEAVKRYLYEQHQIPLHKMNVISYGEEKPVAPNSTRDGRAQNRRIVIKIVA